MATIELPGAGTTPLTAAEVGALADDATVGGDLSGTVPNPTVAKLQGVPVSATAPTSGQIPTYTGSEYAPATPAAAPSPASTVTGPDAFGASAVVGTGTTYARDDHDHGLPSAPAVPSAATTVIGPDAFGASSVVGTGTDYARNDHNHGLPSAPAVPSAATTVIGPDAFGASAVVGTGTTYARDDHDHGLPAAPADIPLSTVTTAGDLIQGTGAGAVARLALGAANQVLRVVSGALAWAADAVGVLTTTGDLLYASAANTLARLGIGTFGQGLSVSAFGLPIWASAMASAEETELTTTTLTNIVAATPTAGGLYEINVYFVVGTATTTVTVQVTHTDMTGAQTTIAVNAVAEPVGSYTVTAFPVASAANYAITVQAQAGTANHVYMYASIVRVS